MLKKKCKKCWWEFSTYYSRQQYCSYNCAYQDRILDDKICPICWISFHPIRQTQVCCSRACSAKKRTFLPDAKCLYCWNNFHCQYKWQRFCSIKCSKKYNWEHMPEEIKKAQLERLKEWNDSMTSQINIDYAEYLKSLWFSPELEFELWWKYFDIKVWDTLIEINPFAYHNITWHPYNKNISKTKHRDKLQLALDNWYKCIMIWDWDDLEKIPRLLKKDRQSIGARECVVKQIVYDDYHPFINEYHLQWDSQKNKNNICVWLYLSSQLVGCMLFWRPRYNWNYKWEILRLCIHPSYNIIGWANKMFKYFLQITWADNCVSYCDLSKFTWWVYKELWFKLARKNPPAKHRYNWRTKQHITDNLLRDRWVDQLLGCDYGKGIDNEKVMLDAGFVEIYDCWQLTFTFNK